MRLISLKFNEFKNYFPRMKEEFPESEMKNINQFEHMFGTDKYYAYALSDNDNIVGMALGYLNKEASIFWLDYLQIFRENQGKQYGSKLLNLLLYGNNLEKPIVSKGLLLEVENPESTDYNDNKVKRMRFYNRFNISRIDVDYLFPCNDGTTIPLNLFFIPKQDVTFISKEDIVKTTKSAIEVIHFDIPHAKKTMETYINDIKDLQLYNFSLTDVDMSSKEDLDAIGELIYTVDPWVYPALFDSSIDIAKKVAPYLLEYETIYNKRFIKVAKINGKIAGFMVLLKDYVNENHDEMIRAFMDGYGKLTPKFNHVMEGYFDTLKEGWEGTQILSVAVLPAFRRMHIASKMIYALDSNVTYTLACVKQNEHARTLYEKNGFTFKYEYPGYTGIPCVELVKKGK